MNAKHKPLVEDWIHGILFKVLPKSTAYLCLVVYDLKCVVSLSPKPLVIFLFVLFRNAINTPP